MFFRCARPTSLYWRSVGGYHRLAYVYVIACSEKAYHDYHFFAIFGCSCSLLPMSAGKGKGKGQVLDIALLHDEHILRSALQSGKWQLIGMSY